MANTRPLFDHPWGYNERQVLYWHGPQEPGAIPHGLIFDANEKYPRIDLSYFYRHCAFSMGLSIEKISARGWGKEFYPCEECGRPTPMIVARLVVSPSDIEWMVFTPRLPEWVACPDCGAKPLEWIIPVLEPDIRVAFLMGAAGYITAYMANGSKCMVCHKTPILRYSGIGPGHICSGCVRKFEPRGQSQVLATIHRVRKEDVAQLAKALEQLH